METVTVVLAAFLGGFFLHRWIVTSTPSISPEQLDSALEKQKESLQRSIRSLLQKSQEAPVFATRFETNLEAIFAQMQSYEMEVTNPEAYDAMMYLLKYRFGEDRLNDRIEIQSTAQRGVKLEVHYVSIKPE